MARESNFIYGGQAVIEGVMIRGRTCYSLAVRQRDGGIAHSHGPLNSFLTGPLRRIWFLRGVAVLAETLTLGMKALHQSANLSQLGQDEGEPEELSGWAMGLTLAVSLVIGIGIFFVLPLLVVWLIDPFITSDLLSNTIEGLLRLAVVVGYIWGIGLMKDIRRVYAYHGAEHMTVHAHEAGLPLTVANVRRFPTPHPRCGTAFLLTVVLVSVVVFAFLGRPDIEWRILSRIVLLPVIAAVAYEIIRFSGVHQSWFIARALAAPGLLLQQLTTRQPDDDQIGVAIAAMELALATDAGLPYPPSQPEPAEAVGEPSDSSE